MNWYKKSQIDANTIERIKLLLETDEENPLTEEDIKQKIDEYYNQLAMEWRAEIGWESEFDPEKPELNLKNFQKNHPKPKQKYINRPLLTKNV